MTKIERLTALIARLKYDDADGIPDAIAALREYFEAELREAKTSSRWYSVARLPEGPAVTRLRVCPQCRGSAPELFTCGNCLGRGKINIPVKPCLSCEGVGWLAGHVTCLSCDGKGYR
jgi:hypothetical protein